MPDDLVCEAIARRTGFAVSVGNWIAPDGVLILGWDYESHHWQTLNKFLGKGDHDDPKRLTIMNNAVQEGYIRLVFRADVLFQVGAANIEELWSDSPNYSRMRHLLELIRDIEIHVFSKNFYVIGLAQAILDKDLDKLQRREKR